MLVFSFGPTFGWPQALTHSDLCVTLPGSDPSLPGICFLDKTPECWGWFIALPLTWHSGCWQTHFPFIHLSCGLDFMARWFRFSKESSSMLGESFSVCYIKRSGFSGGLVWPWQWWDIKSFFVNHDGFGQEISPCPANCCFLLNNFFVFNSSHILWGSLSIFSQKGLVCRPPSLSFFTHLFLYSVLVICPAGLLRLIIVQLNALWLSAPSASTLAAADLWGSEWDIISCGDQQRKGLKRKDLGKGFSLFFLHPLQLSLSHTHTNIWKKGPLGLRVEDYGNIHDQIKGWAAEWLFWGSSLK